MTEDESERRLHEISTKLMPWCSTLEPGEGLSHEEVLESDWLDDEDVEYLIRTGVTVEVARRVEGEPWIHFDHPDGSCSSQVRADHPEESETATLTRKDFAAFVHRIILEGRNPAITVELTDAHTLLLGGFDGEPSGVMIIQSRNGLSAVRRLKFRALMEGCRASEVFDGERNGEGDWSYTYRVMNRQQAVCAEEIVFELFEMVEPVDITWSENSFAR